MDFKATSGHASLTEADSTQKVSYDSLQSSVAICALSSLSVLVAKPILSGQGVFAYPSGLVTFLGAFVPSVILAFIVNRWSIVISSDEIYWKGLRSRGSLRWDEMKSASETSIGGLSLQIEAVSGSFRIPLKGCTHLSVIRSCFEDRGLLEKVELPYNHPGSSAPYWPHFFFFGGGALFILLISVWTHASDLSIFAAAFLFDAISKVFLPVAVTPVEVTEDQITKRNWRGKTITLPFSKVKRAWQDSDTGELTLWSPERELTLEADTPGFGGLVEQILERVPPQAVKR